MGAPELVAIFVLALLLFGPKKLPELGRALGKSFAEFRRATTELKSVLEREMAEGDRPAEPPKISGDRVARGGSTETASSGGGEDGSRPV